MNYIYILGHLTILTLLILDSLMYYKFDKKFTDLNLDDFVERITNQINRNSDQKYEFDFSETEHIGNQELLVFTSFFKLLVDAERDVEIILFKKGAPLDQLSKRVKFFIIQIWEVWGIWKIVEGKDYKKFFGIDGNAVQRLERELKYYPKESEIYNRHGVTPFVPLDFITHYNAVDVEKIISPFYDLNEAIVEVLASEKCYHPFISKSLSSIITEELYLNFLDHTTSSSFPDLPNKAFMSIAVHRRLRETDVNTIQEINEYNFRTEAIPESKNFFYDTSKKEYKNNPYLEFSFLDFGEGIVDSLKEFANKYGKHKDSEILAFAFEYFTSRHPIQPLEGEEAFIPRGLFDVLTLVKRYEGLLVIRSNRGKILYDFSSSDRTYQPTEFFSNKHCNFPGTLFTIYIPAIENENAFDSSAIKPEFTFEKIQPEQIKLKNFSEILEKIKHDKASAYGELISSLRTALQNNGKPTLHILNFDRLVVPKNILKKTIYLLLSDYSVNHSNNVVLANLRAPEIVHEIQTELSSLSNAIQNYKIHPLPILNIDYINREIEIKWLGLYNTKDIKQLDNLLFDVFSLAKSDFTDPQKLEGHLTGFDKHGNLLSNLPPKEYLFEFIETETKKLIEAQLTNLIYAHNCIINDSSDSYFLCNGNYYQKTYIELSNLINDVQSCDLVSRHLFDCISRTVADLPKYKFLGVSASSQKILKSLERQHFVEKNNYDVLDGYHKIEDEITKERIDVSREYILICDVVATGYLTNRLNKRLEDLGSKISYVAVFVDSSSKQFFNNQYLDNNPDKIISLLKHPIERFLKTDIKNDLRTKNIIRINPHTNIPITLSIKETSYFDTVLLTSEVTFDSKRNIINIDHKFLDNMDEDHIKIGFLKFNNLIHPYFFDTAKILKVASESLLNEAFAKITNGNLRSEKIQVFYPRKSGIQNLDFELVKKALSNYAIEPVEIERFSTMEGWKFPHNSNYLSNKVAQNVCLILDDGSCSGDSIVQMIDEIAFFETREIILLCFIGRVNDHKREFFSRLAEIKVKDGCKIPLSIYFISHWHIPTYYIDENPNSLELNWLMELTNSPNAPYPLKNIATNILSSIKPRLEASFTDYRFLPSKKNGGIPKKDLLLVREEVGKVIGYRLYKESFDFFNYFFRKYEYRVESVDRYKEIELLCATFVFEPYLFDRITALLPDITEQIEQFVDVLLFRYDSIANLLTYKWKKKDIIHLFFIVFKNEKLIEKLTAEQFKRLIDFTAPVESSLNYVLYKLLFYFPLKANELDDKKYDIKIRNLIRAFKDDPNLPNREIRRFYNFIMTLPAREDYNLQLSLLQENYKKEDDPQNHIEKNTFGNHISLAITSIGVIKAQINEATKIDSKRIHYVKDAWYKIVDFLNPILTFSATFRGFIAPFPYFELLNKQEIGVSSLRHMVGQNEDVVNSLDESYSDLEKLDVLIRNISVIQNNYDKNTSFYELINRPTSELERFVAALLHDLQNISVTESSDDSKIEVVVNHVDIPSNAIINIPRLYLDTLIGKELITNIKNHAVKLPPAKVDVAFSVTSDSFGIEIANEIATNPYNHSTGEGIKCIKLLSDFSQFGFTYSHEKRSVTFIQKMTFKYSVNGN